MGKVSKNAKTNRKAQEGSKDYVRVIKAVKTKKSSSYSFAEKIVHKDSVKDFLAKD
ncbi:MAG: DUF4295 domain-containing protein [Saprospirales bacterium]|nr:DUF4295 domain-containing protein [Saprospirales bacterium]|tara:strand:+ start:906 stop:1073 length:168 start_codon:yes stop_codon:yes gene_type:complete